MVLKMIIDQFGLRKYVGKRASKRVTFSLLPLLALIDIEIKNCYEGNAKADI